MAIEVETPTPTSTTSPSTSTATARTPPESIWKDEETASKYCNKWVESGLSKNKTIQFLLQSLVNMGCAPPEGFIRCEPCQDAVAGGFGIVKETTIRPEATVKVEESAAMLDRSLLPSTNACRRVEQTHQTLVEQLQREGEGRVSLKLHPEIFVCQQYVITAAATHRTIIHELIHAVDSCRTKMDPLHNCVHMACTEIRAQNLSGECAFWPQRLSNFTKYRGHGNQCVRERALMSVRGNPICQANAERFVDAAFDRCIRDTFPFERHPNLYPNLQLNATKEGNTT